MTDVFYSRRLSRLDGFPGGSTKYFHVAHYITKKGVALSLYLWANKPMALQFIKESSNMLLWLWHHKSYGRKKPRGMKNLKKKPVLLLRLFLASRIACLATDYFLAALCGRRNHCPRVRITTEIDRNFTHSSYIETSWLPQWVKDIPIGMGGCGFCLRGPTKYTRCS